MKTTFRTRQPYADLFLRCAREADCFSPARPERFIKAMKQNRGSIHIFSGFGLDEEGLERKNPVIVALGDSVTAGHFENINLADIGTRLKGYARLCGMELRDQDIPAAADKKGIMALLEEIVRKLPEGTGLPAGEITDARESYIEKFRLRLIDKFEQTSVSVINAGIAGDNLIMMDKRLERDVLRYQPDLVLINGSLNWDDSMGTTAFYKQLLEKIVDRVQDHTEADIVLLTPNGMVTDRHFCMRLEERVEAVRAVACEKSVCLADTYAIWEKARDIGCPWQELLANGCNHPGVEGHEAYAITLMKLFGD